jgi:4-amino-4-deoxy-L-arabinose transferase-like glycosyltransferase
MGVDMAIALPRTQVREATLAGFPYFFIALLAFALRAYQLDLFLTPDEVNFWITRSERFLEAITSGQFHETAISTHPGVTTMWLGSVGLLIERALNSMGIGDFAFNQQLGLMRLPVICAHVATILVGFYLLRRLLPHSIATLAAFLWASDPFVIGYSKLLHVDALAGSFATVSLLAAILALQRPDGLRFVALSAISAALAILSKSPALLLVPMILALSFHSIWNAESSKQRKSTMVKAAVWLAVLGVAVIAIWPALWSDPRLAIERIRSGVMDEGAQPHMLGNFFMGKEDLAPGWSFYPVAVALRLTPFSMVGLLLLPMVLREINPERRRMLAFLALYAILFILAMSIFPKKFNRYLVPIFPSLDILAAMGLWALCRFFARTSDLSHRARVTFLTTLVVMFGSLLNAVFWQPYSITAFNQLLGGAQAGANTFMVGWGEGMDQVAKWLNQQPDSTGVITASTQRDTLQPLLKPGIQATVPNGEFSPQTGYAVVYVRDAQVEPLPPFDQVYEKMTPIHTVVIEDVPYAWIYQIGPPVAHPRPAQFGESFNLRGYTITNTPQRGQMLRLKLFWQTLKKPEQDFAIFLHVVGRHGQRYAQSDLVLPTSSWEGNRFVTSEVEVPLTVDMPNEPVNIVIGLYDPQTGQRLGVRSLATSTLFDINNSALELLEVNPR